MLHAPLPLPAQTAFSQLAEAALGSEMSRSIANLEGTFCQKSVKGKTYWYFQCPAVNGVYKQIYLGPQSTELDRLINAKKDGAATASAIARLSKTATIQGASPISPPHFRIIRRLADHGFFRAGGVLIGSHAFISYGNALGVRWGPSEMTDDVDFAHAGKSVSLALPASLEVNTASAIESLGMGFVPLATSSGKATGTFVVPETPEFRLDFLTPMARDGEAPFEHPQLHVTLTPIRFIEFSLEQIDQAVLFSGGGAVVVNVPNPARYAIHKLIVYGERSGVFRAKSGKDLAQSAAILSVLKESRPWEIEDAWRDVVERGKGWKSRVMIGREALLSAYPDAGLSEALPNPPRPSGVAAERTR